ncbi:MAG: hypothetical protein KJ626_12495 [Verrucomicrobia bacterium]|nr:hypothetical protein [Verrucomicrobiota bacterium]
MRAKTLFTIVLLAVAGWLGGSQAAHAQPLTLDAILIHANNDGATQDSRLEHIEFKLRRIFNFEYYQYFGGSSSGVTVPAATTLNLGHGYNLEVNLSRAGDGRVRAQVRWLKDGESLLATSVKMKRGVPTILGGPPYDRGTLIVVLELK